MDSRLRGNDVLLCPRAQQRPAETDEQQAGAAIEQALAVGWFQPAGQPRAAQCIDAVPEAFDHHEADDQDRELQPEGAGQIDELREERGGEDGYFVRKNDFGVIAQDVQKSFPLAVRTREDGSLAVDYEKLSALALAAIAEQEARISKLEALVAKLVEGQS